MSKRPLLISIGLYLAACALPALLLRAGSGPDQTKWLHHHYRSVTGVQLLVWGLIFGWIRANFAAFANLPLWFSWIVFAKGNFAAARTSSVVALVWSLLTFQLLFQGMWFDEGATEVGFLAAPHVGYFCWLASMLVILISSLNALRQKSMEVIFKPGESPL